MFQRDERRVVSIMKSFSQEPVSLHARKGWGNRGVGAVSKVLVPGVGLWAVF